ncbi:MAG: PEP-CTERM sorting domain-containing protein [Thermoguttaceae bacterium]|nr:PEP-CTERM sorting domain-containing protein [Thermoguttaceae bacterium]
MNFIPTFRSIRFNTSRVLTIVIALAAFGASLGNLYAQNTFVRYNSAGTQVASGTRVNVVLSSPSLAVGDYVKVYYMSGETKQNGTFTIPGGADFTLQSGSGASVDIDLSPCGKNPAFQFVDQTNNATLTLTNVGYYGSWYGGNNVFLNMNSGVSNFLTLNLNDGASFHDMKGVISSSNSNSTVKINAERYLNIYNTTFGFGNSNDNDDDVFDEGKPLKVDISFSDQVNSSLNLSNNTRGVRGSVAYTSGFTSTSANLDISSNSASDSGGVIYATDKGDVSLTATGANSLRIYQNTATNSGGFIYSDSSGNINITSSTKVSLTYNSANNGSGGAIYNAGSGSINIIASEASNNEIYVNNNSAGNNGGVIYNQGEAPAKITFDANKVTVTDNLANTGSGGFIYNEGANAEIKAVAEMTIKRNYASAGNGGAIYSGDYNGQAAENTILIDGTNNLTISNNYAGYRPSDDPAAPYWNADGCNGGAIYSTAKKLQILTNVEEGSTNAKLTFENNFATGNGGAIYNASSAIYNSSSDDNPLFCIHGNHDSGTVTVSRNMAGGSGGAVYNANSEMDLVSFGAMSFQQNEAGISGGAIYHSAPDYDFNLECISLEFSSNTASQNGGAIYLESKKNLIVGEHLNFKNNVAGESGGAIYEVATSDGSTTFNALNNLAITDNIANAGSGGAIYRTAAAGATNIDDLTFNAIDELVINRNYAENGKGGAIYNDVNSDINFTSNSVLSIKNNKAINGGAIYQSGGGIVFDGSVIQDDPSQANFFNNVATGDESTLGEALANDIYCKDELSFVGDGVYTFNGGIYAGSTSISAANVTVYGREFIPGTETADTTNHFRFNDTTISNDGKLTVQFDEIEDYSGVFTLEKKTENATMLELNTETKTRQLTMEEDKLQVLGNGVVEKTGDGALQIVAAADGLVGAESFVISSGRVDYAGYLDASLEVEKGVFSPGSFEDADLIGKAYVTGNVQIKDSGIALFEFGTFPGDIEDVNYHDVLYISNGSFEFDSSDSGLIALEFLKGDKDAWAVDDCWYLLIEGANVDNGDYSYLLTNRYGSDSTHRQFALKGKDGNLYLTTTYYVPEPSTWALLILGAAGLLFWRKKANKK